MNEFYFPVNCLSQRKTETPLKPHFLKSQMNVYACRSRMHWIISLRESLKSRVFAIPIFTKDSSARLFSVISSAIQINFLPICFSQQTKRDCCSVGFGNYCVEIMASFTALTLCVLTLFILEHSFGMPSRKLRLKVRKECKVDKNTKSNCPLYICSICLGHSDPFFILSMSHKRWCITMVLLPVLK